MIYVRIFNFGGLHLDHRRLEDLVDFMQGMADELQGMLNDGVELDPDLAACPEQVVLVTRDEAVAAKHRMEPWGDYGVAAPDTRLAGVSSLVGVPLERRRL